MSSSEDDNVYNVEAIVGYRRNNGRKEYLIKWKDPSEEENTWEPESNLDEGSLKIAKAYYNKQKELKGAQKPKSRKRKLKRKRRREVPDSDDEFISDAGGSYMSDGTYRDQSVDDNSRAEKMPVTPSPQRPRRVCYARTTDRIRKANRELSSDDCVGNDHVVAKKKGARRKIIYEESDDNDTSSENENDNHHEAKLPPLPLPPSQPNLSFSPTKLKTISIQCSSTIDAHTRKRLPYPSRSPHVCYTDADGDRYCYALDTLYRMALENRKVGQKLTFLQPPHFDSPMSADLEDQIACRFGRGALQIEKSKNYRRYYERFVLGLGEHDLYCCPICYNEANRRRGRRRDDNDDDENSDEEFEEDCFTFDDDPMTILENIGSNIASTFCFLKVKGVRMHLQDAHSVDLGELEENDLFKRFMIRSPDGLLQHFVRSNRAYKNDMWSYWRDEHGQNSELFRNLVQLIGDNEDKKPDANQSDFCTSFPKRAKQIWEKVSGPYLKDDDIEKETKFINDNNNDEEENEVRENPYFDPPDESEEEEINQFIEGLKQLNEQNRGSENDDSSSDDSDSYDRSSAGESEEDEESDSDEDEDDVGEDPWLKGKENKMKQKREKRRSLSTKNDEEESDNDIMFESDSRQARKCAKFTASDDEE
eukprot:scaffold22740_cov230-Skeletonema_dohrnii-CCMP3373.AAC.2